MVRTAVIILSRNSRIIFSVFIIVNIIILFIFFDWQSANHALWSERNEITKCSCRCIIYIKLLVHQRFVALFSCTPINGQRTNFPISLCLCTGHCFCNVWMKANVVSKLLEFWLFVRSAMSQQWGIIWKAFRRLKGLWKYGNTQTRWIEFILRS